MKYTTKIDKGEVNIPICEFENGRPVYNKYEHYDIDVLGVTMQSQVCNNEDIKKLAELLYPQVIEILGSNEYIGVRIKLDRTVKTLVSKGQSLNDFQRALLRQYSAMQLDINIFGLNKENNI